MKSPINRRQPLLAALTVASITLTVPAMAQGFDNILPTFGLSGAMGDLANLTPANFLPAVQNFTRVSNARDLAALGKQAANVALHIEELQIKLMQKAVCMPGPVADRIPAQYSKEVELGCEMLNAQAELTQIKRKALNLIAP